MICPAAEDVNTRNNQSFADCKVQGRILYLEHFLDDFITAGAPRRSECDSHTHSHMSLPEVPNYTSKAGRANYRRRRPPHCLAHARPTMLAYVMGILFVATTRLCMRRAVAKRGAYNRARTALAHIRSTCRRHDYAFRSAIIVSK